MPDNVIQQPIGVLTARLIHQRLVLLQLDLTFIHVQHIDLPIVTVHGIALFLIVDEHPTY